MYGPVVKYVTYSDGYGAGSALDVGSLRGYYTVGKLAGIEQPV